MVGGLPSTFQDWEKCTVLLINIGSDDRVQVCTRDFRGDSAIYYPACDPVYFRPIKTVEEMEAEEREKAVAEMREVCEDWVSQDDMRAWSWDEIFGVLHDAGLRFTKEG